MPQSNPVIERKVEAMQYVFSCHRKITRLRRHAAYFLH